MIDLGSELRQAREEKGISLAEAGEATRIKERYLQALEANDWAALPTLVQARGFLRNYAVYLGLDEDEAMSAFSQATRNEMMVLPPSPAAETGVRTADKNGAVFSPRDITIERAAGLPPWISSDIFIGVALALVVALIGFAVLRLVVGGSSGDKTSADATPAVTGIAPQSTSGAPGQATPAPVTPTFDTSIGSVQLNLEATEHVWVRVTVDGAPVLEGILAPGAPQTWQGTQQITLETPNGAGLNAVVNGQPQGPLGERGQAITLAWGPNGLLSPTPTASP